jgi:serine/threonine protein kinase
MADFYKLGVSCEQTAVGKAQLSEVDPDAAAKQRELRGVLPAGSRLRSYELIAVLGQGAFGITYRARDSTLNRDVAIKEYLPIALALREGGTTVMPRSTELAEEFSFGRERFLDEARTLATLGRAPAVVSFPVPMARKKASGIM